MNYQQVQDGAKGQGLIVMGAFHPIQVGAKALENGTVMLLGAGSAFWPAFSRSPESADGAPHGIDRWSERVIGGLAAEFDAKAIFPFGGPPYQPFIDWALKSGRVFQSPTGMLVHDTVGMMISYRGALHFANEFSLPAPISISPCVDCPDQPCTTACPVGALSATKPYDVKACHGYLDTGPGTDCMANGCAARRACPLSAGAGRSPAQSAHHMKAFHSS